MNDTRGSIWRKWDLQVHTPASIVNEYKTTGEKWETFLENLERLPPEFSVVGVNDYIFIDGYKRILDEKKKGRLKNLARLLPVIELRLAMFSGSKGHLNRVNYHVIFSDQIDPEVIEQQFLNALWSQYDITPPFADLKKKWKAIPTEASLKELGQMIIDSVPPDKQGDYGSPLREGFNNLTFNLDQIREVLQRPQFENNHLTAIGKTEWADIAWNDHSIADKKNLINSVDLVL